jgi:hypothetical protein
MKALYSNAKIHGTGKCCGSGMFYPKSGSEHFYIPDPDPGSSIKTGKKTKTNFFLSIYGFQVQVLADVIYIKTIE